MPAIEHSFSEQAPGSLYLDTDILVTALARQHPNHRRSSALFAQLADAGAGLYVSAWSWMEFANAVTKERFRATWSPDEQHKYGLGRWNDAPVRLSYLQTLRQDYHLLLDHFDWNEVQLTPDLITAATELMAHHRLGAGDALQLASAATAGVMSFASFDEVFRRVHGLHLWNDLIHTS